MTVFIDIHLFDALNISFLILYKNIRPWLFVISTFEQGLIESLNCYRFLANKCNITIEYISIGTIVLLNHNKFYEQTFRLFENNTHNSDK